MSDTPRTDAFEALPDRPTNWWDFARKLEQENSALREKISELEKAFAPNFVRELHIACLELERENAALRNKLASYEGQTRFFCQCGGVKL
jgi:hypothetical protein